MSDSFPTANQHNPLVYTEFAPMPVLFHNLLLCYPAVMEQKRLAAEAALEYVQNGMVVGLGTGSTADYFLLALGRAIRENRLRDIIGVPTSEQSARRARELGIPLVAMKDHPHPDVAVDGADEVDPQLNLIKGLGGALLREKIVEQNSRLLIVVADSSKSVPALGTKCPLPVEVAPFAHETHVEFFQDLGAVPQLRTNADGSPFVTDNGNFIYHCRFSRIEDPAALQAALKSRAGIVESGLFINIARIALIAGERDIEKRVRKPR